MSTLALMRFLESAPSRYDRGMRWLTLGRADAIRRAIADAALEDGRRNILEIGCGTGALTELLAQGGACVTALDQNPEMLEIARERLEGAENAGCEILECAAAEIDRLQDGCFDAVVAAFSLSEMSPSERSYVLTQACEKLRPGGRIAIGDEVRPPGRAARVAFASLRAPQALLGWLAGSDVGLL